MSFQNMGMEEWECGAHLSQEWMQSFVEEVE